MINEMRGVPIVIAGEEHELILTTRATKAIAAKYGGLEELGDKLLAAEKYEAALDEMVWLVTLLANQSIMIHNLWDKEHTKPLLTEEYVSLMTSPFELAEFNNAVLDAMMKGTKRYVESDAEGEVPNAEVG